MTLVAGDIMMSPVYTVRDTDTVRAVITQFLAHRISGLPVVDRGGAMVGFVSDGDIMRYIGKQREVVIDTFWTTFVVEGDPHTFVDRVRELLTLNVMHIAKRKVIAVTYGTPVEEVATLLGRTPIKKVPVQEEGVLIGIISRGDVIRQVFRVAL